ncbi:SMI1/KNR4 family protein [Archangium sp.]|uniref:SMI1/KNR4 family protein n=1 Tax=Archangium sp. TaxID=1872627 RepID=UPI002D555079|nr:SMI1/KNR4 family protein [Archangium sp.]HYO52777.1 SMI1/KNR4 family protein [Archangium sp.]
MNVRWVNYIWDKPRPTAPHELEQLEHEWAVRLPEEYKRVVAMYQGMRPEPSVFNIGRSENVFNALLTAVEDPNRKAYSALYVFNILKSHIPAGIFPFANTPGGEYLCLDYRNAPGQPRIVLVTVEMDIYPIADCVSEFLLKLHD